MNQPHGTQKRSSHSRNASRQQGDARPEKEKRGRSSRSSWRMFVQRVKRTLVQRRRPVRHAVDARPARQKRTLVLRAEQWTFVQRREQRTLVQREKKRSSREALSERSAARSGRSSTFRTLVHFQLFQRVSRPGYYESLGKTIPGLTGLLLERFGTLAEIEPNKFLAKKFLAPLSGIWGLNPSPSNG
ncbi:hypothetical protein LR48_Vigan04g121000 [Vigna angularis]|uniref:Uncharacterized protein n=1 Tax=Phaseolus angularis TaxID=3914 RepID=A0A0L9UEQ0_PHAAN|nr:hypothetical protein LR48_Vigan04g121000 [Vigna angularis]